MEIEKKSGNESQVAMLATLDILEELSCVKTCIRARLQSCRKLFKMFWALAPANADPLKIVAKRKEFRT
ncbi:MAG: hypothetical protein DMG67_10630 [Acidobacteria bacterium]|nr:MAG: hypothetical protein DMG67_10630 [Acidobacteriota bacterium]